MSDLEQALNILPITVSVDDKAVKEAVISQLAKEVCLHLRQQFPTTSFDVDENSMKQSLATGLIITQQKVTANPPTFVKITNKYQRKSTPALSNSSSLPNSVSGAPGRAGSPEVGSSNLSGLGASSSIGSLGVQDFMNPDILKIAKLWRFQKLSKGELVVLVQHYTQKTPSDTATKAELIKSLMDALLDCSKLTGAKAFMTVMWKGVIASRKPLDDLRETALHIIVLLRTGYKT